METNIEITMTPEELEIHKALFGKHLTILAKEIRKDKASLADKMGKYENAQKVMLQTGMSEEQFNDIEEWRI